MAHYRHQELTMYLDTTKQNSKNNMLQSCRNLLLMNIFYINVHLITFVGQLLELFPWRLNYAKIHHETIGSVSISTFHIHTHRSQHHAIMLICLVFLSRTKSHQVSLNNFLHDSQLDINIQPQVGFMNHIRGILGSKSGLLRKIIK